MAFVEAALYGWLPFSAHVPGGDEGKPLFSIYQQLGTVLGTLTPAMLPSGRQVQRDGEVCSQSGAPSQGHSSLSMCVIRR